MDYTKLKRIWGKCEPMHKQYMTFMQKLLLNQFLHVNNSRDKHGWDYCSRNLFISQNTKAPL